VTQLEAVLEAGATAAFDSDAQGRRLPCAAGRAAGLSVRHQQLA
jgi:hypothetical protein